MKQKYKNLGISIVLLILGIWCLYIGLNFAAVISLIGWLVNLVGFLHLSSIDE